MSESVLAGINNSEDLKNLKTKKLEKLAAEIREQIIEVVSANGGHLASNLGVVELTIALHKTFNSPEDKIIWDVGHQSYAHKIITGRKDLFHTIRLDGGLSGFPKRTESIHDIFDTGHASTSISAGLGILTGQQMQGGTGKVIAVIGDGAMGGGMAFEALNHAGHLSKNLIIILNDNNMSIGANVGALSRYFSRLTTTSFYQVFRRNFDNGIRKIPFVGKSFYKIIARGKKAFRAIFYRNDFFSNFGCDYVGPVNGHNISQLVNVFESIKKLTKPVIVHVSTIKGKGYGYAEENPAFFHGISPFSIADGKVEKKKLITYTEIFSSTLLKLAEKDNKIVAITAAMAEGTGLKAFRIKYPDRFFDVGIAEQHAITFAAGLAAAGMKPVVAVYSTFMQRAVDQVIHDVAIPVLPVVFILDRAGLVPQDGETHQGIFDVGIFRSVPNLEILSPYSKEDVINVLQYAFDCGKSVMIRLPKDIAPNSFSEHDSNTKSNNENDEQPVIKGRGKFLFNNEAEILLMGCGGILSNIIETGFLLSRKGIANDVYDLQFIKPIDEENLLTLIQKYKKIFFFEEIMELGGVGEYIAALLVRKKIQTPFFYRGIGDFFPSHAFRDELLKKNLLDTKNMLNFVEENCDSWKNSST